MRIHSAILNISLVSGVFIPTAAENSLSDSYFTIAGNSSEPYAVFYLIYQQEVWIKNENYSQQNRIGDYGNISEPCPDGSSFSRATRELQGLFGIICSATDGSVLDYQMNPDYSVCDAQAEIPVMGRSVPDAGGSYVNLLKGGLDVDNPTKPEMVTVILPLKSDLSKKFFLEGQGSCSFQNRAESKISLVNATGFPLTLATDVKRRDKCTTYETKQLLETLGKLSKGALSQKTIEASRQFKISVNYSN
jgi:hypothetical protein